MKKEPIINEVNLLWHKAFYHSSMKKRNVGVLVNQSEIHEIGFAEVKRLNAEMERAITESGFKGSRGEFLKFLRTDSRFYK